MEAGWAAEHRRPWQFQDLAPYLPSFRFLLDDLTEESAASLSARTVSALMRLTLTCFHRMRDRGGVRHELRRLRNAFLAALTAPDTGSALMSVLAYIAEVRNLSPEELRKAVLLEIGPEMEQAMTSTYDQLVNRGRAEGRAEGQAEMLIKLLGKRFGAVRDDVAARVRAASLEDLERWTLRVLDANDLDRVFAPDD